MFVTSLKHFIARHYIPPYATKFLNKRIDTALLLKEERRTTVSVSCYSFVKSHSKSNNTNKQDKIIQMLDLLIDSRFALFGGRVFQQMIDIPMGTNCAPLLIDLLLLAYGIRAVFDTMFCLWTILVSIIIYFTSIQMSLILKILPILKSMILTLTFIL